jgi:hypothetical protein
VEAEPDAALADADRADEDDHADDAVADEEAEEEAEEQPDAEEMKRPVLQCVWSFLLAREQ